MITLIKIKKVGNDLSQVKKSVLSSTLKKILKRTILGNNDDMNK